MEPSMQIRNLLESIEQLLYDNFIVTVKLKPNTNEMCLVYHIIHDSPQLDDDIQELIEKTTQSGIENVNLVYDLKTFCLEVRTQYELDLVRKYFESYHIGMM